MLYRKDFNKIADIINRAYKYSQQGTPTKSRAEEAIVSIVSDLSNLLKEKNNLFDREYFKQACFK